MAKIENVQKVLAVFKAKAEEAAKASKVAVAVGYTAGYALWVHENVEMKGRGIPRPSGLGVYWGPEGQAKFLEHPFRTNAKKYASLIGQSLKEGKPFEMALLIAGFAIQRDSMLLVPVEYGNLRASAFTRKEERS